MFIEYDFKNDFQSIEFDLENKDSIEWKFLDEQELKLNDKIYIKDNSKHISYKLNLYKKNVNLHIFSVLGNESCDYFGFEYPFYLAWINNANVYTFVQDNEKTKKIWSDVGGAVLSEEDLQIFLQTLFKNPPTYYTESTSRSKSIKKLQKLPKKCYYSKYSGKNIQMYTLNRDGTTTKANQVKTFSLEPI